MPAVIIVPSQGTTVAMPAPTSGRTITAGDATVSNNAATAAAAPARRRPMVLMAS